MRTVGDRDVQQLHAELDVAEALSGGISDPAELVLVRVSGEVAGVDRQCAAGKGWHDLHDVGTTTRYRQQLASTTTDHDRRSRLLRRLGRAVKARDREVLAGEAERCVGEEALEDHDDLFEPFDTDRRVVEGDAGLLVFVAHPSRAYADFDATAREQVERGE